MDRTLKGAGESPRKAPFMFELSRTTPAPTLAERLDRRAPLSAAVSGSEARFEEAIPARRPPT